MLHGIFSIIFNDVQGHLTYFWPFKMLFPIAQHFTTDACLPSLTFLCIMVLNSWSQRWRLILSRDDKIKCDYNCSCLQWFTTSAFFRNKKVPVCVSNTSIETPFTRYNRFDNRSYRVNGVMPYADFHKIYLQREKGAGTGMYTVTKRHWLRLFYDNLA